MSKLWRSLSYQPISDLGLIAAPPINIGSRAFNGLLKGTSGGAEAASLGLDKFLQLDQSLPCGEALSDAAHNVAQSVQ